MTHPEVIDFAQHYFKGDLKLYGGDADKVNPYHWGSHQARFMLWLAQGYISIEEPSDYDGQMEKLGEMMGSTMNIMFRKLGDEDREVFESLLEENYMRLVRYP